VSVLPVPDKVGAVPVPHLTDAGQVSEPVVIANCNVRAYAVPLAGTFEKASVVIAVFNAIVKTLPVEQSIVVVVAAVTDTLVSLRPVAIPAFALTMSATSAVTYT
jgi:hypothetical protein